MVRISGKLFATYMVWIESLRAFLNDLDDLVFAADYIVPTHCSNILNEKYLKKLFGFFILVYL